MLSVQDGLVEQLFRWAETGNEPIRSFATGLLAGAMDLQDVASNFKEKNSALVGIVTIHWWLINLLFV